MHPIVKVGDDVWYCTTRGWSGCPEKLWIGKVIAILDPPPGKENLKPQVKIQKYRHHTKAESTRRRGSQGFIFSGYFPHKSDRPKGVPRYWIALSERA